LPSDETQNRYLLAKNKNVTNRHLPTDDLSIDTNLLINIIRQPLSAELNAQHFLQVGFTHHREILNKDSTMISLSLPELSAYKQEWRPGQKVGKIIILRDISIENTHAGHLRILQDLANHKATNFNLVEQMAWLAAIQLLQTLSMGYMSLF
jgi:hypothetical protein